MPRSHEEMSRSHAGRGMQCLGWHDWNGLESFLLRPCHAAIMDRGTLPKQGISEENWIQRKGGCTTSAAEAG